MGTKNAPGDFDCYAAAEPDEEMFVLLARDPLAPLVVRYWAAMRRCRNLVDQQGASAAALMAVEEKVQEALACADRMDAQRDLIRSRLEQPG